jgi:hypothetical protein
MDDTSGLSLQCSPIGKGTKAAVKVRFGDSLIAHETVDLGSEKKRVEFAGMIARKAADVDAQELAELLLQASDEPRRPAAATSGEVDLESLSQAALDDTPHDIKAAAEEMLLSPDLLDRVAVDLVDVGIAGERELAAIVYMTGVSRLLDKPLALIAQGPSSSGKSFVIERTATLFPPESVLLAKSLTPQSLVYMPAGSLRHRWVVAGERSRVEDDNTAEATRGLREMISSGKLSKLIACKGASGQIESRLVEQDGPIGYCESTTLSHIFDEDRNRCLVVNTDERSSQTKAIMQAVAQAAAGLLTADREAIAARHHCLQRMLVRVPVVIPFAVRLCELLSLAADLPVETRRAFPMILQMVEAIALLHQRQRSRDGDGRIIATAADYGFAHRLLCKTIARSVGEGIGDPARRFYDRLQRLDELPEVFTAADIRRHIRASRSTVAGWLSELADIGAIELAEPNDRPPRGGRPPKAYRITDRGVEAGEEWLPAVEELFSPGRTNRTNPAKVLS